MPQGVFNEMQNKTFNVDFKKRMELEQTENKKKEEEVNKTFTTKPEKKE
jgi:hypothetical protein